MHILTCSGKKYFCSLSLRVKRYGQPETTLNHLITSNLLPCSSLTESSLRSGGFKCDSGLLVFFVVDGFGLRFFVLGLGFFFFFFFF